jgi:hypothetical protein
MPEPAPAEQFLATMQRRAVAPKVKVRVDLPPVATDALSATLQASAAWVAALSAAPREGRHCRQRG